MDSADKVWVWTVGLVAMVVMTVVISVKIVQYKEVSQQKCECKVKELKGEKK